MTATTEHTRTLSKIQPRKGPPINQTHTYLPAAASHLHGARALGGTHTGTRRSTAMAPTVLQLWEKQRRLTTARPWD
jgi:hypothetical protein